jgi:hypothetical protein
MSRNAAEFVIESVQIFAQDLHDLHTEFAVLVQEFQKLFARNEHRRRFLARYRGDPMLLSRPALAQPVFVPGPATSSSCLWL